MKSILVGVLVFFSSVVYSQDCARTGSLIQTDVELSGDVSFVYRGDSLVVVLSSNFTTESGPDLDVYLSDEPNPVLTGILLDPLENLSGAQVYDVPSNISLNDFSYISIHCTQYNHLFGSALLGDATGNCGVALTSDEQLLESVKVFSRNMEIKVKNNNALTGFKSEIYTQSGQLLSTSLNAKFSFKVDSVGLYLVKLYSSSTVITQKVIVK